MNSDILLRDPQKTRNHLLIVRLVLRAAPDRAGITLNLCNTVHGLQRGVSQKRHFVGGLDVILRIVKHTDRIANILSQQPGSVGQGAIIRVELLARHPVIHTAVPVDFEFGARLLRPPVAIRQYHHAGPDRFDLDHTWHGQSFRGIKVDHRPTVNRRPCDRAIEHTG